MRLWSMIALPRTLYASDRRMKATVIIPVFNKAPFLQACLESVSHQTFGDLEVIVVDDASTDASAGILAAHGDRRFRVLRNDRNLGPGLAAQRAMDEARGEYIIRMDADDVMVPERVASQVAFLDTHPEVDLCGSALSLLDRPDIIRRCPGEHAAIHAQLLFGVGVFQPTMALRRTAMQRAGLRYQAGWPWYGEDRLFQLEAVQSGLRLANQPEVLLHYREGLQNTIHGRDRWADLCDLNSRVLMGCGHPRPTEAQLEVHAWAVKYFRSPPDAQQVKAFRAWTDHLFYWNKSAQVVEPSALASRVGQAWDELYYHLPMYGWRTVLAYLAHGGRFSMARAYYALRSWTSAPETTRER
jgi:glycosyltransferase involved in cell wall biosynthesis